MSPSPRAGKGVGRSLGILCSRRITPNGVFACPHTCTCSGYTESVPLRSETPELHILYYLQNNTLSDIHPYFINIPDNPRRFCKKLDYSNTNSENRLLFDVILRSGSGKAAFNATVEHTYYFQASRLSPPATLFEKSVVIPTRGKIC